jgi:hypothetical protein
MKCFHIIGTFEEKKRLRIERTVMGNRGCPTIACKKKYFVMIYHCMANLGHLSFVIPGVSQGFCIPV